MSCFRDVRGPVYPIGTVFKLMFKFYQFAFRYLSKSHPYYIYSPVQVVSIILGTSTSNPCSFYIYSGKRLIQSTLFGVLFLIPSAVPHLRLESLAFVLVVFLFPKDAIIPWFYDKLLYQPHYYTGAGGCIFKL